MAIKRNLSQPLAASMMDGKPKRKKKTTVKNADGSTTKTRTRRNILTGRTRTVSKTSGTKTNKGSKKVTVKRKDGTTAKTKTVFKGVNNRKNIVMGEKGKGSSPKFKTITKYKKDGSSTQKNVSTKGRYDTREEKYIDGTGKTSKKTGIRGGSVKSKREVTKYKTPAKKKTITKKSNASGFGNSKTKTYIYNDPRFKDMGRDKNGNKIKKKK